jgi:NAD(P)-dependent dehydrogenase (short-subunit alcohol dehydrogenase family)
MADNASHARRKRDVKAASAIERHGTARLAGKVAVVTGGNRGIGLAIARALAAEGCNVVITGRDRKVLKAACAELADVEAKANVGGVVLGLYCEVRHPKSVAAVFADVKKRWGKLDILANNAGISQAKYSVEKTPIALWRAVIDINLTGTFLCSQAAIPLMPPGSTIVNTLSIAAKQSIPEFAAYNASKHGALGFSRTLREELIPKGIRVMALLPGATDTAIWEQFWAGAPRDKMVQPASVAEAVVYAVLLPPQANLSQLELEPLQGVL